MIAGIVLAAGSSSRLGRPKQLLALQGGPLLRFTLRRVLGTRLDAVYVVLGHHADEIAATIADLPVRIVRNPDAAQGQSTSVLAGLSALPEADVEAVIFLLGDQPQIDPGLVDSLITRWQDTGAAVVAPRYTDGIGNPILFARRVLPEFAALQGDTGARAIVRAHRERGDIALVDVASPAPHDVDTDADYQALLASLGSDQQPAPPCLDWCSEPD
ncbi:MAG: nucleotidyltransferase family protein [Thermomicrobiales bacterium]|nr:nucleotidyltransferase family protein [Thermomicrobiales bacterium]